MNLTNSESEEELPVSFKKQGVSEEAIRKHWQKIAAKIAKLKEGEEKDPADSSHPTNEEN